MSELGISLLPRPSLLLALCWPAQHSTPLHVTSLWLYLRLGPMLSTASSSAGFRQLVVGICYLESWIKLTNS